MRKSQPATGIAMIDTSSLLLMIVIVVLVVIVIAVVAFLGLCPCSARSPWRAAARCRRVSDALLVEGWVRVLRGPVPGYLCSCDAFGRRTMRSGESSKSVKRRSHFKDLPAVKRSRPTSGQERSGGFFPQ